MCEWSHIYDESEWSLMISMLRLLGFAYEHFRGSFFQGNALLMHFLLGPRVAPINKVQVKPGFVMAALIGATRGMENAPCLFTFQKR